MSAENGFLYEELSYEVLGCAFDAFKAVGVGFDEIRYHKIFHANLLKKSLAAEYKLPAHLDYLGEKIADFEIDEIVENKSIVELKAIQTAFIPENYAQIMTYYSEHKIGYTPRLYYCHSGGIFLSTGQHLRHVKSFLLNDRQGGRSVTYISL